MTGFSRWRYEYRYFDIPDTGWLCLRRSVCPVSVSWFPRYDLMSGTEITSYPDTISAFSSPLPLSVTWSVTPLPGARLHLIVPIWCTRQSLGVEQVSTKWWLRPIKVRGSKRLCHFFRPLTQSAFDLGYKRVWKCSPRFIRLFFSYL